MSFFAILQNSKFAKLVQIKITEDELSEWLGLSISTVHAHIQKMMQADIISAEFRKNESFFSIKNNQTT
jgi:predicted transcriptional regulator